MASCKPVNVLHQCKISPLSGSAAPVATDIPPPSSTNFGNLSWPQDSYRPIIRYVNDDFIWLTVAESDADFSSLSGDHARDGNEAHTFVPHLPTSGLVVPVMAIQVTVFPNSGISIGVTNNHSFIDGRSMDHFIKRWLSTLSIPFLDRNLIKDPNGFEKIYLKELEAFMGSEASTATKLESESYSNMTSFGTSIDCRARREMDPLIRPTYSRNCVRPILVTGEKSKLLREDGVVVAAELRRGHSWIGEGKLLSMKLAGQNIAIAGSPQFGHYGMDFGWGRPKKVEYVSTNITGAIFLKESRKLDGGVEIDVALNKKEMYAFPSVFINKLKAAL
ncbi:hypothetical protein NE237_002499 [Protea cynaroides]|uniref:Uncharacterized protein n=1 Tax=Protea cynaroides TaxID=273540 RepID=A0A9Q0KV23_9MAGN|nr:hypothetical protein NE237_002499 [Protea cynaroides]